MSKTRDIYQDSQQWLETDIDLEEHSFSVEVWSLATYRPAIFVFDSKRKEHVSALLSLRDEIDNALEELGVREK